MKALLECEELCADVLTFAAQQAGMSAGELECAFPGFGASVGKEDAIEAGALGKAKRELGLTLVIEEVGGMDELAALLGDGVLDYRVNSRER